VTAFRSRRAAKTALPAISALTLADCVVGSYFHVRGIQRKPGGWRLPLTNIAMGPPIFAPLLFGTSAYLGILASFLRRDDDPESVGSLRLGHTNNSNGWAKNLHEGRFQKHLAVVTALSASCSGFEAFYSHYKNNFRYKAQWTPVLLAPLLAAIWQRVPVHRFWTMLVEDCVEAYYAHPWAWDEIGFGGPAYPRGYIRLENGSAEPWESDEKRYEWKAPANSVSDLAEPIPSSIQHPAPHQ
jgi:hypothetical protein